MIKKLSNLNQITANAFKIDLRWRLESEGVSINSITIVPPFNRNRIGVEVSIMDDNDISIKRVKECINKIAEKHDIDLSSYKLEI